MTEDLEPARISEAMPDGSEQADSEEGRGPTPSEEPSDPEGHQRSVDHADDRGGEGDDDLSADQHEADQGDAHKVDQGDASVEAIELDRRLAEAQRLLARQTDLVERLHQENQELRAGEIRQAITPVVREMIRIHDDCFRLGEAAGSGPDSDLALIGQALRDGIERSGISPIAPQHGDEIDPQTHRVVGVDSTSDPKQHRRISSVRKLGFRWLEGDLVRPAEVRAFRCVEATAGEEEASESSRLTPSADPVQGRSDASDTQATGQAEGYLPAEHCEVEGSDN